MPFPLDKLSGLLEVALCDSRAGQEAHRELFHFSETGYLRVIGGEVVLDIESPGPGEDCPDIFPCIADAIIAYNAAMNACPTRLHLVLNWDNTLRVAAWRAGEIATWDALEVLRKAGARETDLRPFSSSAAADIYPSLYYGRNFDILKRVCHAARRQVESHIKCRNVRVDSHMFDSDSKKMIASSL